MLLVNILTLTKITEKFLGQLLCGTNLKKSDLSEGRRERLEVVWKSPA